MRIESEFCNKNDSINPVLSLGGMALGLLLIGREYGRMDGWTDHFVLCCVTRSFDAE